MEDSLVHRRPEGHASGAQLAAGQKILYDNKVERVAAQRRRP